MHANAAQLKRAMGGHHTGDTTRKTQQGIDSDRPLLCHDQWADKGRVDVVGLWSGLTPSAGGLPSLYDSA